MAGAGTARAETADTSSLPSGAHDDDNLAWKTALVTGGASGIGEALVIALRDRGASVLAVDLDDEGLARVADMTGCATMYADVSTRAANFAAVARCVEKFGSIDMSFLNAGILDRRPEELGTPFTIGDLDFERYDKVRGVLLDAVVHGTAAATKSMNDGGSIVTTASAAGLVPWPMTPIYSAMKHAVVGWTRAIAPTLEADGVRINAICPGGIATPLLGMRADDAEAVTRLLTPAQVADAMIEIALGETNGEAFSIVAGRDPMLQVHEFTEIPDFP